MIGAQIFSISSGLVGIACPITPWKIVFLVLYQDVLYVFEDLCDKRNEIELCFLWLRDKQNEGAHVARLLFQGQSDTTLFLFAGNSFMRREK